MTSRSKSVRLYPKELSDYAVSRARDLAFDSVRALWERRCAEGMTQKNIVDAIDRHPSWVSRSLRGPGNWTLRTIAELAAALSGELEISVHALEDPLPLRTNYHAYADYDSQQPLMTGSDHAIEVNSSFGIKEPQEYRTDVLEDDDVYAVEGPLESQSVVKSMDLVDAKN